MGQLLEELKRRNAVRVGTAYAVTALSALLFSATAGWAESGETDEREFKIVHQTEMEWTAVAAFPGLEAVFLAADPAEEGPYVLRVRFAPGVMSAPHFHDQDRHVTVLSGVWYAGTDASADPDKTTALGPGSFMIHPAGRVHYDGARDVEAIVQITGVGPVRTTFVDRE